MALIGQIMFSILLAMIISAGFYIYHPKAHQIMERFQSSSGDLTSLEYFVVGGSLSVKLLIFVFISILFASIISYALKNR